MFKGKVLMFKKQRGFGYIEPDAGSNIGSKVFCHWKAIKTSDKWPALKEGMRVSFRAEKDEKDMTRWKATEVFSESGGQINSSETEKSLLENGKKWKGICKTYNRGSGEGLIEVDGSGPWGKNRVKVLRSDIIAEHDPPALTANTKVEFQVSKSESGYQAVNVTQPGGAKIKNKPSRKREPSDGNVGGSPSKRRGEFSGGSAGGSPKKRPRIDTSTGSPQGLEDDDPNTLVEVGLLIRTAWVGILIGKKGVTIKEIKKGSNANMKFGEDDVDLDKATQADRIDKYRVLALSGSKRQVSDACKLITQKLAVAAQTLEFKILFLVPADYCGMFIGKKGANIKEIKGDADQRVRVTLGQDPVELPGASKVNICIAHGPRENLKKAIERIVASLGEISARMQQTMEAEQQAQWAPSYGGGFRGGYSGGFQQSPRGYGGNPRAGAAGMGGWGESTRRDGGYGGPAGGVSFGGRGGRMGGGGTYDMNEFGSKPRGRSSYGGSKGGGWGGRGGRAGAMQGAMSRGGRY